MQTHHERHSMKRSRPNAYTAQACERCRSRKQRCFPDEELDNRNCADADVACVLTAPTEKSKRPRKQGSSHSSIVHDRSVEEDDLPAGPQPALHSDTWAAPTFNALDPFAPADPIPIWSDVSSSILFPSLEPAQGNVASTLTNSEAINPQHVGIRAAVVGQDQTTGRADPVSPDAPSEAGSVLETSRGVAMISLEAAAEPHYVGESSGFLWTTIVAKGLQAPTSPADRNRGPASPTRERSPSPRRHAILRAQLERQIPEETATAILESVYKHLHARYPFMDWVAFDSHWKARDGLLLAVAQGRKLNREASVAVYFVLMVFAIGAQLCRPRHLTGLLRSEDYFALALPYLNTIVQLHNLTNVQGLLLLAMYSLRDSRGPSVWYMSGVTIRLCIGLGLHRQLGAQATRLVEPRIVELRKRIFWSCYTLDRMMSLLLGRPPGIADDDIDIDLPDCSITTIGVSLPSMHNSSMRSAVHLIKLQRILSAVQRSVYSVARRHMATDTNVIKPLLDSIDKWEAEIPVGASPAHGPCCSLHWFQLRAVEARLHLLRPLCSGEGPAARSYIPLLAQMAARGCELQKRVHHAGEPSSHVLIHSSFICGLALLYAVFSQPDVLSLRDVFSATKAVSNTLFAHSRSERSTGGLYDVFEELSSLCMEKISQRQAPMNTKDNVAVGSDWHEASASVTANIDITTTTEYADFLRNLNVNIADVGGIEGFWNFGELGSGVSGSNSNEASYIFGL